MSDSEDTTSERSDVESETEVDEKEEGNLDELKENVTCYIKLDDTIKEKKDEIKELLEKRAKYEEFIKTYLEKNNKTKIDTKDGEIVFKKSSVKSPIKEDIIEKAVVAKIKDMPAKKLSDSYIKIASEILEEVDHLRNVNVKNNIRRVKAKVKK